MYRVVIFDFFDTLCPDFYRVWLERNGYRREGEFLAIARAIDRGEISLDEYYQRLSMLSGQSASEIREEFETKTQIDRDMISLIVELRKKYKIGLLSNAPRGIVRRILQNYGLEQYFNEIVISGEVGYVKPDPRIYHLTLRRMRAAASESIFIDDLQHYVDGATKVGITAIRFVDATTLTASLRGISVF